MSGKFDDDGLTPDVSDLTSSDVLSVWEWAQFYRTHETYKRVAVLEGHYFTADGHATAAYDAMREKVREGERLKADEEAHRKEWPGCNMRSSSEGREFWCADNSGGIKRGWAG